MSRASYGYPNDSEDEPCGLPKIMFLKCTLSRVEVSMMNRENIVVSFDVVYCKMGRGGSIYLRIMHHSFGSVRVGFNEPKKHFIWSLIGQSGFDF